MVRRIGSFVALLLVATLVLAACGSSDEEIEPTVTRIAAEGAPQPTTPGEEGSPSAETPADGGETAVAGQTGGEAVTIDVELVDILFEPAEITVPANTDVTVNLTNTGAAAHSFTIESLGVDSGELAAGENSSLTFNSGAAGEHEFICTVPGHKEAGMVGTLIVTAEAAGAASPETGEEATPAGSESPAAEASPVPEVAGEATPAVSPAVSGSPAGETVVSPAATAPTADVTTEASPVASPAAATTDSGAQTTFDVSMIDIAFEETEITVPANTEITINLTNNGAAAHNFTVDELGVASGDYAAGQSGTVTFNSGAPGEYEFYCSVPGHREGGMVGKLIVQ